MAKAQDGSTVVLRFAPFLPDRLTENAEETFEDDKDKGRSFPRYGVSVLAADPEEGEDLNTTIARILATSKLQAGRKIAVLTRDELEAEGFSLVKDATENEPSHHLVGDDPFTAPPRADKLASLMQDRVNNPAWKKEASK